IHEDHIGILEGLAGGGVAEIAGDTGGSLGLQGVLQTSREQDDQGYYAEWGEFRQLYVHCTIVCTLT
ncbi:hypothetical protein ACFL45_10745, partial [Candidatus Neomarinimicrobiota bacterium]